jgi:hypothetical protein
MTIFLKLCVWSTDVWEKRKSKSLQVPSGRSPTAFADTRVQFHQDQVRLLVTHESQIAVYDASKLELVRQVSCFLLAYIQTL